MLHGLTAPLERYLDLLSTRQRLTASNLANADSPG
jgi:flagellar basal body rod protein FlgB